MQLHHDGAPRRARLMLSSLCSLCSVFVVARAGCATDRRTEDRRHPGQLPGQRLRSPSAAADAHAMVFGKVSDFYWEASYQKTFLSGDTFGWFTLPISATICDTGVIAGEANEAATAAGVNLAALRRSSSTCSRTTAAAAGGHTAAMARRRGRCVSSTARVQPQDRSRTRWATASGCSIRDALDCGASHAGQQLHAATATAIQADTMGNRAAHFNAFQKERLGWFNAPGMPPITTITSSGRYTHRAVRDRGYRRRRR